MLSDTEIIANKESLQTKLTVRSMFPRKGKPHAKHLHTFLPGSSREWVPRPYLLEDSPEDAQVPCTTHVQVDVYR